ncbi:MAG TPA: polysaccharide deacetylase, partial [Candidatus Eisenbacteria bacterium]|nr:polysaccharide deacetylase [Candidatus Eisenbacteria bacterium]
NGWSDLDRKFPDAFRRYVYGPTSRGDYGLPIQFKILNDHGLTAAFFVEPLFSLRFGRGPLEEMVGLVRNAKQEVQLHLHTEWLDEPAERVFPEIREKRQFLYMFDGAQQTRLFEVGLGLLRGSGATGVNAFRAGSFGLSEETFAAARAAGLAFDTSFNPASAHPINRRRRYLRPVEVDGIAEYPLTIFRDGLGKIRQAQVGSCSLGELKRCLWSARDAGWGAVVILSHNFEMMNANKDRPDMIVVRRFEGLCRFLAGHREEFRVRGFSDLRPAFDAAESATLPSAGIGATAVRYGEQGIRRLVWHRSAP